MPARGVSSDERSPAQAPRARNHSFVVNHRRGQPLTVVWIGVRACVLRLAAVDVGRLGA
jgi:hypothetical protein